MQKSTEQALQPIITEDKFGGIEKNQKTMDTKYLPVIFEEWNEFLKKKARKELNEDEVSTTLKIKELKELIKEKKLSCCTDSDFLIWFLRCKKFDVQCSFEQILKYSDRRHNQMLMYENAFFERTKTPIELGIVGILPKRDAEGRVIIYLRPGAWLPDSCDFEDIIRTMQSLSHFVLQYPATQVSGFSLIFEADFISLNSMLQVGNHIRQNGSALNAFPGRFQRISVVNANIAVRGFFNLAIAVLPSKVRQRVSFYGNPKTNLPKIFHPSILPEEYGGSLGPLNKLYNTWLLAYRDYLPKLRATNVYYK